MKIIRLGLLIYVTILLPKTDFFILNSIEDAKKYPELTQQLGKQLRRISPHVVVYSITPKSNYPLQIDLEKSQMRRDKLIPLLEYLGLEVTVVDACTPADVDYLNWEKIREYYFHVDSTDLNKNEKVRSSFFSQNNWDQIITSLIGKPYWVQCDNWERKVPGTEILDSVSDEIIRPIKRVLDPLTGLRQMACFESHLKALNVILDKFGEADALLLEDDTNFAVSSEIINELEKSIDQLVTTEEDWTELLLGASFSYENLKNNSIQAGWKKTDNLTLLTGTRGTFAQAINGKKIKHLTSLIQNYLDNAKAKKEDKILAIDSLVALLETTGKIKNLGLNPLICGQANTYSVIMDMDVSVYYENQLLLRQGLKFEYPEFNNSIKPRADQFYDRVKEQKIEF
jgi:GR25 family glycosyltransferase involved in LPS biosynthesis